MITEKRIPSSQTGSVYVLDEHRFISEAKALLALELEKSLRSAEKDGWISEEKMWQEFGVE